MKVILTYNEYGLFTSRVSYPDTVSVPLAGNQIYSDVSIDDYYYDIAKKEVVKLPPRPSVDHVLDKQAKQWVLDDDSTWIRVRMLRDRHLALSDWRVTKALESGVPMDPAWAAYRQALRDITNQTDPHNIVWPTPPA